MEAKIHESVGYCSSFPRLAGGVNQVRGKVNADSSPLSASLCERPWFSVDAASIRWHKELSIILQKKHVANTHESLLQKIQGDEVKWMMRARAKCSDFVKPCHQ